MAVEDENIGKYAATNYEVVKRYGYVTMVKCNLETGRTHQIRVHLKYIGHTLFGDYSYGGDQILSGTVYGKYKTFIENCWNLCHTMHFMRKALVLFIQEPMKKCILKCLCPKTFRQ